MGNLISAETTTITTTPIYMNQPLATAVLNKQQQLISNLEDTIKQSRKALVIDATNKNTTEGFVNVSDYYTSPIYMANTNTPELKDYVDVFNKSIALLDDPNQINKTQFDTYIHLQNKKIAELQNAINTFPTNANRDNPIKAIKNLKTSQSLNVEEYRANQPNGSTKYPNYLIYGNNGCLEYENKEWNFKSCNSNNPNQRFNMSQINTLNDYNSRITDPTNKNHQITDANSTIMGFYVVNPENDNNQCLTLNNDGLSVMPCSLDASQRFKPYYHSIIP